MKKWNNLLESKEQSISRGAVLRTKAKYPYENEVDFMLVESSKSPSGFALMVATGYKAGLILQLLPLDAVVQRATSPVISLQWLKDNWVKWIYEVGPEEVYYNEGYSIEPDWNTKIEPKLLRN
ncbi:MAG: Imm45 family immunity protein [Bdellovibrionia bacterium]